MYVNISLVHNLQAGLDKFTTESGVTNRAYRGTFSLDIKHVSKTQGLSLDSSRSSAEYEYIYFLSRTDVSRYTLVHNQLDEDEQHLEMKQRQGGELVGLSLQVDRCEHLRRSEHENRATMRRKSLQGLTFQAFAANRK